MKTQLTKESKLILAGVSRCQNIYITIALLHRPKTEENGLSMENQGNLREFTKLLREGLKTAKSPGILWEWLW